MSAHLSRRTYLIVFAVLMGLLALTVGLAYLPYRDWGLGTLGIAVALTIAVVKAALVALYFMHLRASGRLVAVCAVVGLFWLAILFSLTFTDYLTRGWLPASRSWVERPVPQNR